MAKATDQPTADVLLQHDKEPPATLAKPSSARKAGSARRSVCDQRPPAHLYDRLPFVTVGFCAPRTGRDFWAPRPTGDYSFDCTLGEQYADAVLALPMSAQDAGFLLTAIVNAILDHGNENRDRAIIIGMMSRLGAALVAPKLSLFVPSSDTDLLAACDRFHQADKARLAEDDRRGLTDERAEELDAAWDDAFKAVCELRPRTPEGLQARATVARIGLVRQVKAMKAQTWEEQASPWEWLAIDCLSNAAEGVA